MRTVHVNHRGTPGPPVRAFFVLALFAGLSLPGAAVAQEGMAAELDSLRAELERLGREQAVELRRIMEEQRAIQREMVEVRRRIQADAFESLRETLREEGVVIGPGGATLPRAPSRGWPAPPGTPTRSDPPVLLGQRVVAGAEMASLNPSLARYFGVDSGVLVMDVAERSPAADAGLQPGDVVLEVNGERVETIQDLREQFSQRTIVIVGPGRAPEVRRSENTEIVMRVVREGESMELTFPR